MLTLARDRRALATRRARSSAADRSRATAAPGGRSTWRRSLCWRSFCAAARRVASPLAPLACGSLGWPSCCCGLRLLLAFLAAIAPTLVVALDEAAHGLDHAEIVVGVLPVGLGQDAVARGRRLAGQRLVLVEHLVGVAAHPDVGSAAVENLVSIGRTIGIVIVLLLVMVVAAATAAATIATAARPLTIVWSH